MPAIVRKDSGLRPIQIPAVFNRDDRIRAGTHVEEAETAIQIGLVPAKPIVIRFRIFGDQNDHRAGNAFSIPLGKAFDGDRASYQGK